MNRRIDDNIAVASRSAAQRETLSMKRSRINDKLMKARKAADEPQMIDAFTDLQDLQRETSTVAPVLKPSWPEFVALLAECQQLTNKVEQHKPEYPVQEARQNLLQIAEAAKAAYDAGNQEEYRQRYDQVMSIGQALYAEVQDKIETPPPPPPEEAARNRVKKLQKQCEDLVHSAENLIGQFESRATGASDKEAAENRRLADGARSHKQRVWEGAEKLESLLGDCATDPQGVQSDCNTVEGVLDRSKTALDQLEKVLRGEAGIESVPWL